MRTTNRRFRSLPALACTAAIACADGPSDSPVGLVTSHHTTTSMPIAAERPAEAPLVDLAGRTPGFGGLYVDQDGIVIMLTPKGDTAAARAIARARLPETVSRAERRFTDNIRFRDAQFEFTALQQWRDAVNWHVLAHEGVVFTSVSVIQNRYVIGVLDSAVSGEIWDILNDFDVPSEAVVFEVTSALRTNQQHHLRAYYRPLEGGYILPAEGEIYGLGCTLGFGARYGSYDVVLTASHCSKNLWSLDYTNFYQHLAFHDSVHLIGFEIHDPSPFNCGFMWAFKCRWSDATIIGLMPYVESNRGYIARTTGPESIHIEAPPNHNFEIVAPVEWGLAGTPIHMMGQASGWTSGTITHNCKDLKFDVWKIIKCGATASYSAQPGDSGAPVFGLAEGGGVYLFGLHHGDTNGLGTFSWFGGIVKDVGALEVRPPGAPRPPPPPPVFAVQIDGRDEVRSFEQCLYSAQPMGGTPGYTYEWRVDGAVVGTDQLIHYTSGTSGFFIEVFVRDASDGFAWNGLSVVVDDLAPECLDW